MNQEPFFIDLDNVLKSKAPKLYNKIPRFALNWLKRKIHLDELNDILRIYADDDGVDFAQSCVDYFNLKLEVSGLNELADDKRFIFVSNHPLGGLDGICLSAVIGKKYDKKIKYIVNDVLYYIRNLKSIFIPVNKYGKQTKEQTALATEAFASDNQIVTFPAGMCSRRRNGKVCDLPWTKSFVQKAIESKRDVVPVYFGAKNSNFFYRFANIRERLGIKFNIELVFLPDEMFKNKNQTFSVIFGKPIPYTVFDTTKTSLQWAEYVKEVVYDLPKLTK